MVFVQTPNTVVLPMKASSTSRAHTSTLHILRVLEFKVQSLKSGVVLQDSSAFSNQGLLFVRGAPGVIKGLVQPASLPPVLTRYQLQ